MVYYLLGTSVEPTLEITQHLRYDWLGCVLTCTGRQVHFIAYRDLGCIQKHSGACESPKAVNRVHVTATDDT